MTRRHYTIAAGVALGMIGKMLIQRPAFSLRHKTVFVTGGSRGLGLLLALEFAALGARVAISARDPQELARAEELIRAVNDRILTIEAQDSSQLLRWPDTAKHPSEFERILRCISGLIVVKIDEHIETTGAPSSNYVRPFAKSGCRVLTLIGLARAV